MNKFINNDNGVTAIEYGLISSVCFFALLTVFTNEVRVGIDNTFNVIISSF